MAIARLYDDIVFPARELESICFEISNVILTNTPSVQVCIVLLTKSDLPAGRSIDEIGTKVDSY